MALVDPRLEESLTYAGLLAPLSKLLLSVLIFLYGYLHNYGLAIIILTLLIKLIFLPFSFQSTKRMQKGLEMQRKLKYLQHKHQHDQETLLRERHELMRKEMWNSSISALPHIAQLPLVIALNRVLSAAIQLYQAPFLWIPDLSTQDPYCILPMLILLSMLLHTMLSPQMQLQWIQIIIIAFVFGAFTANFAAGLCLYIFCSTLISTIQLMVQQRFKLVL